MAQKILGLDIGAHSVKAVLLEGSMRGWELKAHAIAPIGPAEENPAAAPGGEAPAEDAAAPAADLRLSRAIGAVAQQLGGVRSDIAAVALPGTSAASPILALPFAEQKKIEATLGFEVEGLLPFDVDEALYDYQVLAQDDGKSELLVGVVRRDEFAPFLAELQGAGLDPRLVTLPGIALADLGADLARRAGLAGDEFAAILDLGHERSVLSVVRGAAGEKAHSALAFSRTFSGGGAELPGIESADLRTDEAARRRLHALLREVRQSLRAAQARTRKPVSRIFVGGALAQVPGLVEHLGRDLGLPAEPVTLPGDAGAKIPAAQQPAFALALGLALRAQARGGKQLNFRKGPFAFKGDLDYLKGKASRLVAFAAVLVVLFGANFWARLQTVKAEEAQLDDALCEVTQRVLGQCETDFNLALSKLQGGDTHAAQIPTASAMEVFTEAVARVPTDVGLKFEELDVTLERMRLKGVVDSFDGVDQVVAGMKKSRCIGDVKRGRVQRNRDEKIEFTIDAAYVCGQNANAGNTVAGTEG